MYKNGQAVLISGKLEEKTKNKDNDSKNDSVNNSKNSKNNYSMSNPFIEAIDKIPESKNLFNQDNGDKIIDDNIIAIYNECKFMTSKYLSICIKKILTDRNLKNIIDPLPDNVIQEMKLTNIIDSFKRLHFPKNDND